MTLLITAFGPFDGGWNCSERLLDALRADSPVLEATWGGDVAFERFPVDTEAIGDLLHDALGRHRPTHVLLMGQAGARDAVSLERVAQNIRDLSAPDACGRIGELGPVRRGGPATLRATWPDLDGIAAALNAAGVPAYVSDDAGSHLCNQTLYLALQAGGPRATFLHLPLTTAQVDERLPAALRRPDCSGLPLAEMTRAIRIVLGHTRQAAAAADLSAEPPRTPPRIAP